MTKARFVPYSEYVSLPEDRMHANANHFCELMAHRRSVRQFSTRSVDRSIIERCIQAAHSGPSGANMQPWHFVVVSNPQVKAQIREGAEAEEREFYSGRAGEQWMKALEPIGTVPLKPFLDDAPYLIVVFQKNYAISVNHHRQAHYYVPESVGIAVGILISGLQHAGLASLIHTPRPMGFLRRILKRPANERACMIIVTGYPAPDASVPVLKKKPLEEAISFI